MSKRPIVTGAVGFIGKHLSKLLEMPVRCDTEPEYAVWAPDEIDIHFQHASAIYHLGAISSTTETDINKIAENNIKFSCYLLENAIKNNIPFVYASSASVYGLGNNGFSEEAISSPVNYYAISKTCFDMFVMQKIKDNPSAKIVGLRYFNVYGSGEDHKNDMASPVHKFLNQSKLDNEIKIFKGSENFLRDFVHVDDVVAITKNSVDFPSGIYNVGTGKARSFLEVAEIISKLTGAKITTIPFPDHLVGKYQDYTCSNNSKIDKTSYSTDRISLEDGIKKVFIAATA